MKGDWLKGKGKDKGKKKGKSKGKAGNWHKSAGCFFPVQQCFQFSACGRCFKVRTGATSACVKIKV